MPGHFYSLTLYLVYESCTPSAMLNYDENHNKFKFSMLNYIFWVRHLNIYQAFKPEL